MFGLSGNPNSATQEVLAGLVSMMDGFIGLPRLVPAQRRQLALSGPGHGDILLSYLGPARDPKPAYRAQDSISVQRGPARRWSAGCQVDMWPGL